MNYELDNKVIKILEDMGLVFGKVSLEELEEAFKLYKERMEWFRDMKIKQWSHYLENHPREEFEDVVKNSNYFYLKENGQIIALFELSIDSKYWNIKSDDAYYLYKLATKVGTKGIGDIIFMICKNIVRKNNKKYVRVACLNSNLKLNEIYDKNGFKFIRLGYEFKDRYSLREWAA